MLKKILTAICATAMLCVFATGCTSTRVSKTSAPTTVGFDTEATPQVEYGDEISGEATVRKILIFTLGPSHFADGVSYGVAEQSRTQLPMLASNNYSDAKSAAAYNACDYADCDIIVAPRYEINVKDYIVYKEITAEVVGYAGHLKGIEK